MVCTKATSVSFLKNVMNYVRPLGRDRLPHRKEFTLLAQRHLGLWRTGSSALISAVQRGILEEVSETVVEKW